MAGHKYWRVINVINRIPLYNNAYVIDLSELRFININKTASDNGANAIAYDAGYPQYNIIPKNVFDNNPSTIGGSLNYSSATAVAKYWIGYKFDVPVTVTQIQIQMRQDMKPEYGREWQTATVEYSDDGTNWVYYGRIEPKIGQMDLALKTVPIIRQGLVSGNSKQDNGKISRFVLVDSWDTGERIAKIVPDQEGNWSKQLETNVKVIVTHIGEDGYRPKSDAPIIPIAID